MIDLISQNFALFIFVWLIGAIITSFFARSKKRSFFQWLIIGLIFGWAGIILVLIITREDKKPIVAPGKDPVDRKLWYNEIKSEVEKSKTVK